MKALKIPGLKKDLLGGSGEEDDNGNMSGGITHRVKFDANQEYAYLNESVQMAFGKAIRLTTKCQLFRINLETLSFQKRDIVCLDAQQLFGNLNDPEKMVSIFNMIKEMYTLSQIHSIQKVA